MATKITKDRLAQRPNRALGADISSKLRKIVADIKEGGNVNLTRLTILKKWFEVPGRLPSFGVFIATQASRQTGQETDMVAELFDEVRKVLADVNVFEPDIPRSDAARLHVRLQEFQNEYRNIKWGAVRIVHNMNLFLVEGGLQLYLWHGASPTEGYRLAGAYCEHYDPRYGNGLNGPSISRIEEIADFLLARETHEATGVKSSFHES